MTSPRERAVMQQLVRKVKNEKKGAARELRKDAAFLAAERHTQHKAPSDYLNARGKRALQIMEEQEAIMKKKVWGLHMICTFYWVTCNYFKI